MAALGMIAVLLTSFVPLPAVALFLVALPLVLKSDRLPALSGLLTGFGGLWLLLIASQIASGATLDNASFWLAVGVIPLAIGLALGAAAVAQEIASRGSGVTG